MKLLTLPLRALIVLILVPAAIALLGAFTLTTGIYAYLAPELPSTSELDEVRLQEPLRIYSSDGKLMGEFANERRIALTYDEIPQRMVQAILAAEDDRFFEHPGVDYQGLLRAVYELARTGKKTQGGSTITMQVARNFFLTPERSFVRKLREIFLSLQMETELSKERILSLYLNKIFLGNRAYGVAAAALTYYGKPIDQLDLAQFAMIAGLPKAPSTFNPIVNPQRAKLRRDYVLRRMRELEFITAKEFIDATAQPLTASIHTTDIDLAAPYVAEMVRAKMVEDYGDDAYNLGLRVYTTIDSGLQLAAIAAMRSALHEYDERHGYRGPVAQVELPAEPTTEQLQALLKPYPKVGDLLPALVVGLKERSAVLVAAGINAPITLEWDAMSWARPWLSNHSLGAEPKSANKILSSGDVVYLQPQSNGWRLTQIPQVSGALVSLRPNDGAILALQGGYDYFYSKFNRVIQAHRQPGSNFKPFIYSAALENGFTVASTINDAPVVFEDNALEGTWRPENYSGQFFGPTRMRVALYNSRNLVSIRLLLAVGIQRTLAHVAKFGFNPDELPRNLSLALGSANLTPLQVVSGYAVLANGGYRVAPYFITRIEDGNGKVLFQADPATACLPCANLPEGAPAHQAEQSIDPRNTYLITSMLQDVITRGTGRRALELKRGDLAGKTGTTNDQMDAWFSGYNSDVVASAWVGFDTPTPMGRAETGGRAALPMWIDYMRIALANAPEHTQAEPPGMVRVRIDPTTGLRTNSGNPAAVFEIFRAEHLPSSTGESAPIPGMPGGASGGSSGGPSLTDELF